jgi:hypothetical protein
MASIWIRTLVVSAERLVSPSCRVRNEQPVSIHFGTMQPYAEMGHLPELRQMPQNKQARMRAGDLATRNYPVYEIILESAKYLRIF